MNIRSANADGLALLRPSRSVITTTFLVSYHSHMHGLVLLAVPLAAMWRNAVTAPLVRLSIVGLLFLPTAASGQPQTGTPGDKGLGAINQGFIESSNVSVVEEMVNMIAAQRAFEVNSKAIKSADEMLAIANQMSR